MNNNQQLTIYHDNLQVILHDEELKKIVLWDATNRTVVVRDIPPDIIPNTPPLHSQYIYQLQQHQHHQQHQQQIQIQHQQQQPQQQQHQQEHIHEQNQLLQISNSSSESRIVNSTTAATHCPLCQRPFGNSQSTIHRSPPPLSNGVAIGSSVGGSSQNDYSSSPIIDNTYMSKDYFLLLESSSSNIPSATPSKSQDPFSEEFLNSGYYRKFFQETKKIGSGGFGAVYHCRHLINTVDLGEFAVKKVPVGENLPWLYRVLQEVKALETLQKHKNIINYKHSWLEYDQPANFGPKIPCLFILMEYANSGNLQDYVSEKQILPENEIWSFFIDLCHGIGYLHHSEIIHRDLKPQNILLHQYYDPVCDNQVTHLMISDFGTCDTVSGFKERLKRTGNTGTMEYVAPELFERNGSGDYTTSGNEKCDIWSLGILLYEMSYGRLPYKYSGNPFVDDDPNRNVDLLINEIASFSDSKLYIPLNPPRSKELKETILALLRRNPNDRPSISQILSTPFVQMKTKNMSINPINIKKEIPSIRKATIRKRNLKKSKEIFVEQLDSYDTDIITTNTTTTTSATASPPNSNKSIIPPIPSHLQHHHHQATIIEEISASPSPMHQSPTPSSSSSTSTSPSQSSLSPSTISSQQLVLLKKNVTSVINDSAQQTALSLTSAIIGNQSPRQLSLPPAENRKPALSQKLSLHYGTHLAILLFQVWICFDQCLPNSIPMERLLYPTLFLSAIALLIPKKRRIELSIIYTIRFLWFIIISSFINRGCRSLNDQQQQQEESANTTTATTTTNISYSVLIYIISLMSMFN